ncbi:MAG: hypothetical protein ACR2N5_03180 [Solirubrobacterales bacterium]
MAPDAHSVVIEPRFNGPPESGNGGYVCGTVANLLGPGPAEVALRVPPPLGRNLEARVSDGKASLHDGDTLVAEGRSLDSLDLEVPGTLEPEAAETASARFPWFEEHIFPTCFVCGPRRPEHDGLQIHSGRAADTEFFGATWMPAKEFAGEDGAVRPEIVWGALDCPTAPLALTGDGEMHFGVLGTLAASIDRPLTPGEPHAITVWSLGVDGRKRGAAAAITAPDGEVVARSRALWIELKQ